MSAGPHITFSVPKPPSSTETSNDPQATLLWIKARILELISAIHSQVDREPVIDRGAYLVIYTTIHDFCTTGGSGRGNPARGRHLLGGELYHNLEEVLESRCQELFTELLKLDSDAPANDRVFLETYMKEWTRYLALAKINANLFRFLERHWIKRELDEGKTGLYSIYELHVKIWKEQVVVGNAKSDQSVELAENSAASVWDSTELFRHRGLQTLSREGDQDVQKLFDAVRDSFNDMGLDMASQQYA